MRRRQTLNNLMAGRITFALLFLILASVANSSNLRTMKAFARGSFAYKGQDHRVKFACHKIREKVMKARKLIYVGRKARNARLAEGKALTARLGRLAKCLLAAEHLLRVKKKRLQTLEKSPYTRKKDIKDIRASLQAITVKVENKRSQMEQTIRALKKAKHATEEATRGIEQLSRVIQKLKIILQRLGCEEAVPSNEVRVVVRGGNGGWRKRQRLLIYNGIEDMRFER